MFSGGTVLPDSKEAILGSSNQDASPSGGKNNENILFHVVHGSVFLKLFPVVSFVSGCHLLCSQMCSQLGSQNYFGD